MTTDPPTSDIEQEIEKWRRRAEEKVASEYLERMRAAAKRNARLPD